MEFLILLLIPIVIGVVAIRRRHNAGARGPEGELAIPGETYGIANTSHRTNNYGPGT